MSADRVETSAPLAALLADRLGAPARIARIPGGQSHPVYRIDARSGAYLLRRKPDGALLSSAHAIDREFRLLSALHPLGLPVPEPIFLHDEPEPAGTPFYVMRFVEGRTLWDPRLPDLEPAERAPLQRGMARLLAQLHAVEVDAAGLGDFSPRTGYATRQVARWSRQYAADAGQFRLPALETLFERLEQASPISDRLAVVHGDWRLDNLRIDPVAPRVAAILDWELATLGDPVADLAYALIPYHLPRDLGPLRSMAGVDRRRAGLLGPDEIIAAYVEESGADAPDLAPFLALAFMRLAGIAWGIAGRVRRGNAVGREAEKAGEIAQVLATTGLEFIG
jgi:aminoglycoside phosphotransferase (APT) family kinase protein